MFTNIRDRFFREAEYMLLNKYAKEAVTKESSDLYGLTVPSEVERAALEPIVERFEEILGEKVADSETLEINDLFESEDRDTVFKAMIQTVGHVSPDELNESAVKYRYDETMDKLFKEAVYKLDWNWDYFNEKNEQLRNELKKITEAAEGREAFVDAFYAFIDQNRNSPRAVGAVMLETVQDFFDMNGFPEPEKRMFIDALLKVFTRHT